MLEHFIGSQPQRVPRPFRGLFAGRINPDAFRFSGFARVPDGVRPRFFVFLPRSLDGDFFEKLHAVLTMLLPVAQFVVVRRAAVCAGAFREGLAKLFHDLPLFLDQFECLVVLALLAVFLADANFGVFGPLPISTGTRSRFLADKPVEAVGSFLLLHVRQNIRVVVALRTGLDFFQRRAVLFHGVGASF